MQIDTSSKSRMLYPTHTQLCEDIIMSNLQAYSPELTAVFELLHFMLSAASQEWISYIIQPNEQQNENQQSNVW